MPIPCVDVIIDRDSKVLLGFRTIPPYRNVWALPGGRIHKHEHPRDTAERMLKEIGVSAVLKDFIGVFPVRFSRDPKGRYDITLCYSYRWKTGEPTSTPELVRLKWFPPHRLPKRTGGNYRKMIQAAFSPQHDD
jgi:ADP-ribose pyrophosphatase YjhB (NUDIX family)